MCGGVQGLWAMDNGASEVDESRVVGLETRRSRRLILTREGGLIMRTDDMISLIN